MDKLPKIEDPVVESIEEDVMDVDMKQIANEEEELKNPVEEQIIEKVKVPQDEVFGKTKTKNPEIKKIKKPKREISEAQRERLAKGRAKALANRQAKAKAKKEANKKGKEDDGDELCQAQSDIEYNTIPDDLKEEFKKTAVKDTTKNGSPIIVNSKSLSEEQVAEISAKATKKALEDYEILRKKRKEEKNKLKEEENHRQQVRNVIQKATQRDTTFDFCFA